MAEDKKAIVITPPSFEGVMAVAILEEILNKNIDLEVRYQGTLDLRDPENFDKGIIHIILGLPHRGGNLPEEFYEMANVPFEDFLHFSTYGEEIEGEHITSLVDENKDPVWTLYNLLKGSTGGTILESHVTLTDKAEQLVEATNAYRTWTWEGNQTVKVLLALYNAGYKRMPNLIRGKTFEEMVRNNAPLVRGQIEKMSDHIERAIRNTKVEEVSFEGQACVLKTVFADTYINEIANELLKDGDQRPIIVCVGRATKGDDLLSIRTTKVDASRVAFAINEGQGKEAVATAFFGTAYATLVGKSIKTQLELPESE